jgi:transcriptional regulator with XRE-family HTH domain
MNAAINLLEKYKKACSLTSDNACSASLGVSRQAVSKWRNGENHPDADIIEKMCTATGEPLRHWLPLVEAERARSPAVRKVWLRLAQAAAMMAGAFLLLRHGIDAHGVAAFALSPVYIMRNS